MPIINTYVVKKLQLGRYVGINKLLKYEYNFFFIRHKILASVRQQQVIKQLCVPKNYK